MEMLDKYTQTYMTTLERHSEYTAFSFAVCRLESLKREAVFLCPRHEVKTVYRSRSDKQCEWKHTSYWKSMTHSGTVSDARTNCSYWSAFRAFRAFWTFITVGAFRAWLPISVYHKSNIITMPQRNPNILLASFLWMRKCNLRVSFA